MNQWQSQSRHSLFIFRLSCPSHWFFSFLCGTYRVCHRSPSFFSHFTSSHFHFSSFHHLLHSLLHLVYLSSRPLVLPSFSSASYFCPLRVHALLRFIFRIFTDIPGPPRIQLFPFLFPTRAPTPVRCRKNFSLDPPRRDFGRLVMQFCSQLTTVDNKLIE